MSESTHLLDVQHLKKYFKTPGGMLHAVDDVSFTIDAGKTLGVVGESGCGKSTLGRTILGLAPATEGEILFRGKSIVGLSCGTGTKATVSRYAAGISGSLFLTKSSILRL